MELNTCEQFLAGIWPRHSNDQMWTSNAPNVCSDRERPSPDELARSPYRSSVRHGSRCAAGSGPALMKVTWFNEDSYTTRRSLSLLLRCVQTNTSLPAEYSTRERLENNSGWAMQGKGLECKSTLGPSFWPPIEPVWRANSKANCHFEKTLVLGTARTTPTETSCSAHCRRGPPPFHPRLRAGRFSCYPTQGRPAHSCNSSNGLAGPPSPRRAPKLVTRQERLGMMVCNQSPASPPLLCSD